MQSTRRPQQREGIFPAGEAQSVDIQHAVTVSCLYSGLESLTDHWEEDKEEDDSVMSSDDCNMAIKAGSLEEEARDLQALKVCVWEGF